MYFDTLCPMTHKQDTHLSAIGYWCHRASQAFRYRIESQVREIGLTSPEALVLGTIHRLGPSSLMEIARDLGQTHPSILRQIDLLEENGLIERKSHDQDRRVKVVHLTDKGRERMKQLKDIIIALNKQATQGISDEQRETTINQLKQYSRNLAEGDPTLLKMWERAAYAEHMSETENSMKKNESKPKNNEENSTK